MTDNRHNLPQDPIVEDKDNSNSPKGDPRKNPSPGYDEKNPGAGNPPSSKKPA